jgi:mRNA-degrading endonuclease RelE of RelBE toxin-antitoxin system
VLLDPRAAKALKKLDEATRARIKKALLELAGDPYKFGEQMHPSNFRKIKQGDYRTIYEINKEQKQIIVLYIGHRKNVYDNFANLLY